MLKPHHSNAHWYPSVRVKKCTLEALLGIWPSSGCHALTFSPAKSKRHLLAEPEDRARDCFRQLGGRHGLRGSFHQAVWQLLSIHPLHLPFTRFCVSNVLESCKSDVDFFNLRVESRLDRDTCCASFPVSCNSLLTSFAC